MTTLRPERPADGPMSYEDTGQFRAVVESLDDPLTDPLPGRAPEAPEPQRGARQAPSSPWFSPAQPPRDRAPGGEAPPAPVPADMPYGPGPAPAGGPGDLERTAQLPVVDEPEPEPVRAQPPPADDVPGPAWQEPPSVTGRAAGPVAGPADGSPAGPADGGRAARRKAARQGSGGGGHRARGRAGGTAAAAPAGATGAPLSRVEARKARQAAKDSPVVVISRIVGELFITVGVLLLLFVTYQLWWTNVRAHAQANGAAKHLQQEWNSAANDPNRLPGTFQPGQGFAIMYIPKLDVKAPIAQGVSKTKVLDKGEIGHYDGALNTAMPWDKSGNFAVAAHRNTHGEPFRYINRLVPGDKVVVETANAYYTYQVTSTLPSTSPDNIGVLRPVPAGSGFTRPGRYITLTTCTPEFTSKNRLIVWGKLIEERPRSKGKPDALMEG